MKKRVSLLVFLLFFAMQCFAQYSQDIFVAVANNDTKKITQLLSKNRSLVNIVDPVNGTPLQLAVRKGNSELVSFLVINGADINSKDLYGLTAIHDAAQNWNEDILNALLVKKAAQKAKKSKLPSFRKAKAAKQPVLVYNNIDLESKANDGSTPLHKAALKGSGKVAELLIKTGAKVNSKDNSALTPLHYASKEGNIDVAKVIANSESDFDLQDSYGNTPLHYACQNAAKSKGEIIKELLKHNANFYIRNQNGDRPFDLLVDANLKNSYRNITTDLHNSVYDNDINNVKFLIEKGAKLDAQDYYGNTPLHLAVYTKNLDIINLLMVKGADLYITNSMDKTPAESSDDHEIASTIYQFEKSYEYRLRLKLKDLLGLEDKLKSKKTQIEMTKMSFDEQLKGLVNEVIAEMKKDGINSLEEAQKNQRINYDLSLIQEKYAYIDYLSNEQDKIMTDVNKIEYMSKKTNDEITLIKTLGEDKLKQLMSEIDKALDQYGNRISDIIIDTKNIKKKSMDYIWENFIQYKLKP